jgi:type I restriction enzyme M protein
MVDMIDPKLGERILDPVCGTGGFLTCALEHIKNKYVKTSDDSEKLHKLIRGVEKKPLPHLLCMTNMLLHGVEVSAITHDNTGCPGFKDLQNVLRFILLPIIGSLCYK